MTLKVKVKCHHMQSHPSTSQDTPHLVFLGGQTCFGTISTVFNPNDLEGQGQMSPYAITSENIPRYTYKPNLVILRTFFQMLLDVQVKSGRTDGRTDGRTAKRYVVGPFAIHSAVGFLSVQKTLWDYRWTSIVGLSWTNTLWAFFQFPHRAKFFK